MVMALEDMFASMKLGVIVPDTVHDLPDDVDESWLRNMESGRQREKAFYDERLALFFTATMSHPTSEEQSPNTPPLQLAQYLSRLQITLDAKYISAPPPIPSRSSSHHSGINLALPPRSQSQRKGATKNKGALTIFPPHTPNPTPQTAESDRKYVANTEGTILESFVWGETAREEPEGRKFALIWSNANHVWVAVYRLTVGVAYLRTSSPEPILSLTVSATLREKPLAITPDRQALSDLLRAAGGILDIGQPPAQTPIHSLSNSFQDDELHGLQEVNLLEGLSTGPTFGGDAEPLQFPSTRLASSFRRAIFSLPPLQPPAPVNTAQTLLTATPSGNRITPVLRMSYMKTLQTVSGFQIRMKSVFAPYVAIPGTTEDEDERREAGSEERTIVLSVELANGSPFSGPGSTGFNVEGIDVTVGGEGAVANLISWGQENYDKNKSIFPLLIGPAEQFNLLYAITFMRQSEADDIADTLRQEAKAERLRPAGPGDLQRPVSIVVRGRPFDFWNFRDKILQSPPLLAYPTKTFKSRWNCILDLSSNGQTDTFDTFSDPPSSADALPAPATPFPVMAPVTAGHTEKPVMASPMPRTAAVIGGGKRHTFGGIMERLQRATPVPHRNSTPAFAGSNTSGSPMSSRPNSPHGNNNRPTPPLPSLVIKGHNRFSSTAAITNLPSPGLFPQQPSINGAPPPTPAYPAYPVDAAPPTAMFQSPISSNRNSLSSTSVVEPRRERGTTAMSPQTPGPRMFGSFFPDGLTLPEEPDDGEPIVVSAGLIPRTGLPNPDVIYTLDTFGIEIFVFNRSERTRRFEVSYPDKRRRRQHTVAGYEGNAAAGNIPNELSGRHTPGLLPLDDRIRIGPLRPHTCQSVRMQFLALRPGVHSITSLTFTDVESGFTKNLKSVMDIVVYNGEDSLLQATDNIANLSLLVR